MCKVYHPYQTPDKGQSRGIYTILVIGEWPVLILEKRELAFFLSMTCEYIKSADW